MKRCSMSLIIREMQIKTTVRYLITSIRMSITNKSTSNKWGCGEETLVHCWWECRLVQPFWKSLDIPRKIKNGTELWPSNSHYGNITKETWNTSLKEYMWYMYPYVHCSIIYNSQDLEAAQVPISRWMDKKAVVHLHNTIQLQKPFVTAWIGLESIMLSEINQSEKDKYHMILLTCGI